MQLLRNEVLIKPFKEAETKNGIIVPESARGYTNRGEIVSVGSGTVKRPMKLKKGDVCHRVKNWGQEVEVDGELHFIMDDSAVIALEK